MALKFTDETSCPECGGNLKKGWDGYLHCDSCSAQFFVDDDGTLTGDAPYDEWMPDFSGGE